VRIESFMLLALIVMIVWSIRLHKKDRRRAEEQPEDQESEDMSVDDMVLMDMQEDDDLSD
jgi:hypothetical protein